MSEEPDDNSTMYVYNLKDIPGGPSNRLDVLDLYVKLLKGKGFVYSNSQGGISYGYTYDVYNRGIFPSLEYMVSVGTIYKGTTPIAIAINVIDMQK